MNTLLGTLRQTRKQLTRRGAEMVGATRARGLEALQKVQSGAVDWRQTLQARRTTLDGRRAGRGWFAFAGLQVRVLDEVDRVLGGVAERVRAEMKRLQRLELPHRADGTAEREIAKAGATADVAATGVEATTTETDAAGTETATGTRAASVDETDAAGTATATGTRAASVDETDAAGTETATGTRAANVDEIDAAGTETATGTRAANVDETDAAETGAVQSDAAGTETAAATETQAETDAVGIESPAAQSGAAGTEIPVETGFRAANVGETDAGQTSAVDAAAPATAREPEVAAKRAGSKNAKNGGASTRQPQRTKAAKGGSAAKPAKAARAKTAKGAKTKRAKAATGPRANDAATEPKKAKATGPRANASDAATEPKRAGSKRLVFPITDYDELSAKAVLAELPRLSQAQCETIREREFAHKKRKSILRALDARIES